MVQKKTWTIWKIRQLDLSFWKAMNGKNYLITDKILCSLAGSFKQENTFGFWLTYLRLVPHFEETKYKPNVYLPKDYLPINSIFGKRWLIQKPNILL